MGNADKLFQQLNSKTISDNDASADIGQAGSVEYGTLASAIQLLSNSVHLEKANEDYLKALVLVNAASMRDGGVIPGTQIVFRKSNTQTDPNDYYDEVLTPQKGEVYVISTLNWESKNASSMSWFLRPADGSGSDRVHIAHMTSVTGDLGTELPPTLYVAYPNVLDAYVDTASGTNIYTYSAIRVR